MAILDDAVSILKTKFSEGFDGGSAKLAISDVGSIIIDASGANARDGDADVTLSATGETFMGILEGTLDPTSAYMSGKLTIDGDMGLALALAGRLA